jgi:hypothetical protein
MAEPDDNWAGKGFNRRNEESAPEPEPKLRVVKDKPLRSKPEVRAGDDGDEWIWK